MARVLFGKRDTSCDLAAQVGGLVIWRGSLENERDMCAGFKLVLSTNMVYLDISVGSVEPNELSCVTNAQEVT